MGTLHIATPELHVSDPNLGSNPLAFGSDYHVGPDAGIFGVGFSPDTGRVSFNDLFATAKNPLLVETTNAALSIVHGANPNPMSPFDVRIRIAGVSYKIPFSVTRQIRGKNGGRVYWRTSRNEQGSFRFFRRPPAVFR